MTQTTKSNKLTKAFVDGLEPQTKDYFLWDKELRGFGVKVTPKGRKVYVAQFRVAGVGNARRMTIGVHGEIFVQKARQLAADALSDARKGDDPTAQLKDQKKAATVSEAMDRFFDEHVRQRLKASTIESYELLRRVHLEPAFGKLRLVDVTRDRVAKFHAQYSHERYSGNKLLAVLSKFFNWCEANELTPQGSNPCRYVSKYKEEGRERFLNAEELVRLRFVMETAEEAGLACKAAVDALRLLLLTGARRDEILKLRWEYVDFERGTLNLPDSKTGKKSIVLSQAALTMLANLERDGNPFVIPGRKPGAHLVNLKAPWHRIREAAGLPGVRIHDLRHTFASHAINRGEPLEVISKLLGHSQLQTTQRYAHLQHDRLRDAANAVASSVAPVE